MAVRVVPARLPQSPLLHQDHRSEHQPGRLSGAAGARRPISIRSRPSWPSTPARRTSSTPGSPRTTRPSRPPTRPGFAIGTHRFEVPWLQFDVIGQTLSNPDNRLKLLKFLLYRQAPGDTGAREHAVLRQQGNPGARAGAARRRGRAARRSAPAPSGSRPRQLAPRATPSCRPRPTAAASSARPPTAARCWSIRRTWPWRPTASCTWSRVAAARVTAFNPDGTVASTWGGPGQGDGQFQEPWGIAVAPNGNVYVADTWNHRVQYFDPNGKFLGKWGRLGDAKGRTDADPSVFWGPRSIAISPAGEVYVTDTGNKRIQVFGLDGTLQAHVRRRRQRARPVQGRGRRRARRPGQRLGRRHLERPHPEAQPDRRAAGPDSRAERLGEPERHQQAVPGRRRPGPGLRQLPRAGSRWSCSAPTASSSKRSPLQGRRRRLAWPSRPTVGSWWPTRAATSSTACPAREGPR